MEQEEFVPDYAQISRDIWIQQTYEEIKASTNGIRNSSRSPQGNSPTKSAPSATTFVTNSRPPLPSGFATSIWKSSPDTAAPELYVTSRA